MESSDGALRRKYQHHPIEFKREVVRASLESGKSVARLALEYGLNANQIWAWRKSHRDGRLALSQPTEQPALIEVDVVSTPTRTLTPAAEPGRLEIVIGQARVCVTGTVDALMLKTAISALLS